MEKIYNFLNSLSDPLKAVVYGWMWFAIIILMFFHPGLFGALCILATQIVVFLWNNQSGGQGRKAFMKQWKKLKKL
jgi:hypothetical protein